MLAAVAFEIVKRLLAVFIAKFPTYMLIYGALAAIPVFLSWIYMSWLIILIGAVFVASLPVIKYERWQHVETPGSTFVDALLILNILFRARTVNASAILNMSALRAQTRLGFDEMETLLQKMADRGWVGRVHSTSPQFYFWTKQLARSEHAWVLLVHPKHLMMSEIYRLFVFDVSHHKQMIEKIEKNMDLVLNESLETYLHSIS